MPTNVSGLRTDVRNYRTFRSAVEIGIAALCMIVLAGMLIALSVLLGPQDTDLQSIGPLVGP